MRMPLGDIADFINGYCFKQTDWNNNGLPIIRIQNLTDESKPFNKTILNTDKKYIVEKGDILVSWSATLGVFEWSRDKALLNQHIFKVIPNSQIIDKKYLFYSLQNALSEMNKHLHGATMRHINRKEFVNTNINVPSLDEQRRIAKILDKSIAINQKVINQQLLYQELTQSLFKNTFGNLLTIPSHEGSVKLIDLVDFSRGISYGIVQRGLDQDEGVNVVRIRDFENGNCSEPNQLVKTSQVISDKYKRTLLKGGEIIISIRGTVGRCAIVPLNYAGSNVSREVAVIPLKDKGLTIFLLDFLRSENVQHVISGEIRGIAQKGINLADLRELSLFLPEPNLLKKYYRCKDNLLNLKKINTAFESQTSSLNKSLIHSLIS